MPGAIEPNLLGCTLEIRSRMGLQRSKLRSTGSPFAFFASFADKPLRLICERTLRALSDPIQPPSLLRLPPDRKASPAQEARHCLGNIPGEEQTAVAVGQA